MLQRHPTTHRPLRALQTAAADLRTGRVQALPRCGISRKTLMDSLSRSARSERMSRVRNKDTKPEWTVRRLLYGLGFRYRLHRASLPGRPDIVFPGRRKAIFVHGCFWHRHPGCCRTPKSRLDFWLPKLSENRQRDLRNQRRLKNIGWDFLVVWECELKHTDVLARRFIDFLGRTSAA